MWTEIMQFSICIDYHFKLINYKERKINFTDLLTYKYQGRKTSAWSIFFMLCFSNTKLIYNKLYC